MTLTDAEVKHLLAQPEIARMLASFNRIRSADVRNDDGRAIELLRRSREFEAMARNSQRARSMRSYY